jgi:glucose/galactose transporter
VHAPYLLMAALLALLAFWIARSSLPDLQPETANDEHAIGHQEGSIFSFPHLWLGVVCLFLYVGVEVLAGDAIGAYGAGFNMPFDETRLFTSYTLFAMLVGYVSGLILIPNIVSQQTYLAISAVVAMLFSAAAYLTSDHTSIGFIAALGFANAMMWPAIFPLAIKGLGRHTEAGSALLIMAIAGGALLPYGFAHLKQVVNFQLAYLLIAVPSYLYILYYGLAGYRAGQRNTKRADASI